MRRSNAVATSHARGDGGRRMDSKIPPSQVDLRREQNRGTGKTGVGETEGGTDRGQGGFSDGRGRGPPPTPNGCGRYRFHKTNGSGCERCPSYGRLWSKRRDSSDGCRCESFPHVQWTVGRATPLMDALATTTAPGSSFPWMRRIQGRVSDHPRRVLSSCQGDGARREPLGSRPRSMRPPIT